jgi:hypothetical protein
MPEPYSYEVIGFTGITDRFQLESVIGFTGIRTLLLQAATKRWFQK